MNDAKSMDENLDEFKRLSFEINQTKEKLGKESEAIILLNSLPDTYKEVKVAMKYGRDNISTDSVIGVQIRKQEFRKW
ncbi:copia-like retroelement pol polyprotein [Cucumis melo var. makuwa]|uniref:Copia-like retroelement pol polyprotein n=1 Tax=Cucumis melo var. makuwa TaxID=1194695 RepID=A0A5A7U763_CUCMM|nr:copia-like retroelement pol polyprotein [Cucumis melo var. makuwa]